MRIVPREQSLVSRGFRSGRLKVVGRPFYAKHGIEPYARQYVVCLCSCGCHEVIPVKTLTSPKRPTQSCGCMVDERAKRMGLANAGEANGKYRHGGIRDPLYKNWAKMKDRCENKNNDHWHRYGGRGIMICPEWQDYAIFRDWALANGHRPGLSLDRIDNDGNYEPGNCQWLTRSENVKKAWRDGCLDHRFPNKARVAKRPEAG